MDWLIVLTGYIIGSFPTAYLAGRILRGRDIRSMGDENAGAANAYRELGAAAGILVGLVDAAKGVAVILIARSAGMTAAVILLSGL
ncbi:MAG: glycerol-3-phosphate acyltransferase, partial [Dehalococcoidales bacterium]|nr:glycerol-3-phosphate acyltransferase [Dehalococcoidales bacterium]